MPSHSRSCNRIHKRSRSRSRIHKRSRSRSRSKSYWINNGRRVYRSRAKQTTTPVKKSPTIKRSGIKYDVHDNGGRPFRVYINGNKVDIYKNTSKEYNGYDYPTLTKSFKADKIFIGSGPRSQKGNSSRV